MYDFANILFSGPCNARCPFCIGRQIDPALNEPNLDVFPPRNLDRFLSLVRGYGIRQVVVTGTNTDPQLYRHERKLLAVLRGELPTGTRISLHTNGLLALEMMEILNLYDRVSLSIPALEPEIYRRMMGVSKMPAMGAILARASVPIKVSCVVTDDNRGAIPEFLAGCQAAGVGRVVLRKLMGEARSWGELILGGGLGLVRRGMFRNNPVYDCGGMEVTLWDFATSRCRSINVFSSGDISDAYLLTATRPGGGGQLFA
jgi:molybdenum cofactor biosynthesis enzyme MoaA